MALGKFTFVQDTPIWRKQKLSFPTWFLLELPVAKAFVGTRKARKG